MSVKVRRTMPLCQVCGGEHPRRLGRLGRFIHSKPRPQFVFGERVDTPRGPGTVMTGNGEGTYVTVRLDDKTSPSGDLWGFNIGELKRRADATLP